MLTGCNLHNGVNQEDFTYDEGIYIEKQITNDHDFSQNNIIYQKNRCFIFEYSHFTKENELVKIKVTKLPKGSYGQFLAFDKAWEFTNVNSSTENTISNLSLTPVSRPSNHRESNLHQTIMKLNYTNLTDSLPFVSHTGLVENKMNVWLHPFRSKFFKILQLNPYPFIQHPFEVGNKWEWELDIGQQWGDERWKTWKNNIKNKST